MAVICRMVPGEATRCGACWYDLSGLPRRGRCPECGTEFNLDAKGRRGPADALPLERALIDLVSRLWPTLRTVGILLLVLGHAALIVGLGVVTWMKVDEVFRPGCW